MSNQISDKIVIDVGVGKIIEEWLSLHYRIISIRQINNEMSDLDILKLANEENALIITMGKDFSYTRIKNNFSVYQNGKLRIRTNLP